MKSSLIGFCVFLTVSSLSAVSDGWNYVSESGGEIYVWNDAEQAWYFVSQEGDFAVYSYSAGVWETTAEGVEEGWIYRAGDDFFYEGEWFFLATTSTVSAYNFRTGQWRRITDW